MITLLLTWSHVSLTNVIKIWRHFKTLIVPRVGPRVCCHLWEINYPNMRRKRFAMLTILQNVPCVQTHVFRVNDHQRYNWINYVCPWHAMQNVKWRHCRKCDFFAVSHPILQVSWKFFSGNLITKSSCFCTRTLILRSIQGIMNKEIPLSSFSNSFTKPGLIASQNGIFLAAAPQL